jgi:hypothetical protein
MPLRAIAPGHSSYANLGVVVSNSIAIGFLLVGILLMAVRRQWRSPHHHLVFVLFLTLFFRWTLDLVLQFTHAAVWCWLVAFVVRGLKLAGCFWEVSISFNLFRMVVMLQRHTQNDLKYYHWLNWSAALFFCSLPMTTDDLARPPVCWILTSPTGIIWHVLTYDATIGFCILMILVVYILVLRALVRQRLLSGDESVWQQKGVRFSILYPIIFVVCWIPTMIYDITLLVDPNSPAIWTLLETGIYFEVAHSVLSVIVYSWPTMLMGYHRLSSRCCQ